MVVASAMSTLVDATTLMNVSGSACTATTSVSGPGVSELAVAAGPGGGEARRSQAAPRQQDAASSHRSADGERRR